MKRLAESLRPEHEVMKRLAESLQPSQAVVRRMAELIQPNAEAMRRLTDSLRIEPATIAAVNRQLAGGFDWQAAALAMSGGQAATFAAAAAESTHGEAAEALADLESAFSQNGEDSGTVYEWFRNLAPLAQDRVFLVTTKSLAAVVLMAYAEVGAHPPFHMGIMIVLLIALADMGNAKND